LPPHGAPLRTDSIDVGTHLTSPSITPFADGSYVIAYTDGIGLDNSNNIVARIVSANGAVGSEFALEGANDDDDQNGSQLATLSNGNFVAVYEDEFHGSASDHDVKYGIFTKTGSPVTADKFVPGANGFGLESDPDVAALRDGGFVVVWTDPDTTVTDIRASILSNTGAAIASNILVNTNTGGAQNEASVVALADGGFLVSWENDGFGQVRAQRFDADGSKIGVEFAVKNSISGTPAEAALLTDGRIAFAVGDLFSSGNDADVMTSIWDPRTPVHNFDGINQSDFLWQHDNGQAAVWLLHDTSVAFNGAVGPNVGSSWHLIDDGDFNADGRSDFLWQNDSGQAAVWGLNNGTTLAYGAAVGANPGPSWHVIGAGDFNGDNKSDILWQGDDGTPAIWLMDGLQPTWIGAIGPFNPGPSWQIKGTGDFNGDGKADIIWQGQDGTPAIWLMDGTNVTFTGAVGPFNPGPSWHIEGTGDFNGDNKSDILWQNDDGTPAIWLMNGTTVIGLGAVGTNPGASWHVVGAGQLNNGDTNADILWQHDNGQAAVWLMDGMDVIGNTAVGGNPGAAWHLIA
jgi:hypothetical protein